MQFEIINGWRHQKDTTKKIIGYHDDVKIWIDMVQIIALHEATFWHMWRAIVWEGEIKNL